MLSIINTANFYGSGKLLATTTNIIYKRSKRKMNCYKNCVIRAESVHLTDGKYSIVVAEGALDNLCDCRDVEIGIYTSIPRNSDCNLVEVTDGTTTLAYNHIKCCCDNVPVCEPWRTTLRCRTIIVGRYSASAEAITARYIKGKRGC